MTSCLKIDPSTVFSAFDMDKLRKSAPLERAAKKIRFHRRLDTARKAPWGKLSHKAPLEQGSMFIFYQSRQPGKYRILARLQFGLPGQKRRITKTMQPSTNTLFRATCSFVYFGSFFTEPAKHFAR